MKIRQANLKGYNICEIIREEIRKCKVLCDQEFTREESTTTVSGVNYNYQLFADTGSVQCGTGEFQEPFYWLLPFYLYAFLLAELLAPFLSPTVFRFSSFILHSMDWSYEAAWGLRTDRVLIALSQPCIANLFNNNN